MEPHQDLPSADEDAGSPARPPQNGKLDRIAAHTQGLITDLREWIDLRIDLAVIELEERVDDLRNNLALGLTMAFLGFFALLFSLTTLALGLGWLLGHAFWGFLIVSALLLLIVVALRAARPALLPSSDLFEKVRGRDNSSASEEENRPSREASASMNEDTSTQETVPPSS